VRAAVVKKIEPYKTTTTYDLEVEGNHNYFAGNTLVSNCHNVEPQLLDFVSLTVSDANLSQFGIYIPELDSPLEYAVWFEDAKVGEHIYEAIEVAREQDQHWLEDELSRTLKKYKMFLDHVQNTEAEWVHEYEEVKSTGSHKVTLKPVYVHGMAHSLLFRYAKRVVMMSATVLDVDVMCRSLGINRDHVAAFRMKNRFPAENRPIYLQTVAKMTGGRDRMREWGQPLVEGVNGIARKYPGKRGIIHTHNFAIQELLKDRCDKAVRSRFLLQQDFKDKQAMLDTHARRDDSIIVAPAMHEGIDLHGELSRFQIICKVPWPNFFDNEQLSRRIEIDRKYYIWLTALKLVQSYGRSVRSEVDFADTYILDESIYKFLKEARKMLPDWFQEAIKYE
jgi:Rad3-related DNA helicase